MTGPRDFRFDVTPEAAQFVRRLVEFGETREDFVVTIAPQTQSRVIELEGRSHEKVADEIVKDALAGSRAMGSETMELHWVVGVSKRNRFPPEDILVCCGVPCFIPEEMKPILNGRALVLANDELRIEPEPETPKPRRGAPR